VTDEESGKNVSPDVVEKDRNESGDSISVPMMSDVFTWRHVEYDISLGKGETRRLLDDISGYVAPGKLTALMGESGAGKVSVGMKLCGTAFLISFSQDHVVKCPRRAPGSWRCPWREVGERVPITQRFPGADVSTGVPRAIRTFVPDTSGCFTSGYVQQMDTHLAQTTVREALLFSAKLRQPPSVPLKEKEA
jgi:ATP-binding cassette, subfamily G (WHITE), member 2, SNQ2